MYTSPEISKFFSPQHNIRHFPFSPAIRTYIYPTLALSIWMRVAPTSFTAPATDRKKRSRETKTRKLLHLLPLIRLIYFFGVTRFPLLIPFPFSAPFLPCLPGERRVLDLPLLPSTVAVVGIFRHGMAGRSLPFFPISYFPISVQFSGGIILFYLLSIYSLFLLLFFCVIYIYPWIVPRGLCRGTTTLAFVSVTSYHELFCFPGADNGDPTFFLFFMTNSEDGRARPDRWLKERSKQASKQAEKRKADSQGFRDGWGLFRFYILFLPWILPNIPGA
ncbi:hypothetical protein B0T26DRAFT_216369 [Lasiosphaeria miniovina]|uniref:Uncharacterized protein n=1 Tax=Lasiosphaeria miniovina TaxID=1954250 RepID=A0AA40AUU7_9PEZI|nr:uncharacterized protein B0T26DRAFT_216369 [Lasiosphaeria miniovina]KAK0722379.1 hypothetical protein B0T26DRAFT_216369 [Lasiosphaeria miniovina]